MGRLVAGFVPEWHDDDGEISLGTDALVKWGEATCGCPEGYEWVASPTDAVCIPKRPRCPLCGKVYPGDWWYSDGYPPCVCAEKKD